MAYGKAAAHFTKALNEMIDPNSTTPWANIDEEIKGKLLEDQDAIKHAAAMADGLLVSMSIGMMAIDQMNINDEVEREKRTSMMMLDIVSTAMLRAFAIGVHCQRVAAEVELLNSLAEQ